MTDIDERLYPVYLNTEQLQVLKVLLEDASMREADPNSPTFNILDEVRAARRRSPFFKIRPGCRVTE